jgi:hypothetical protein
VIRRVCSGSLLWSFSLVLFAAPSRAQTTPAPSSAPSSAAAQVDPKVTAMAKDWLHRIQTANVDRSAVSFVGSQSVQAITIYHFVLAFKAGNVNELLGVDGAGKIAGLRFTPAQ